MKCQNKFADPVRKHLAKLRQNALTSIILLLMLLNKTQVVTNLQNGGEQEVY